MKLFPTVLCLAVAGTAMLPLAGTAQTLTEGEAVALAVERNPGLQASLLDRRAAREAIRAAEYRYEPVFSGGVSGGHTESSGGSSSDGLAVDAGILWTFPLGTSISAGASGSWTASQSSRSTMASTYGGPSLGVEARVEASQPLLRGAGLDVGEAELRSSRLAEVVAGYQRDEEAAALLQDVRTAYWELWYAQAAWAVQQTAHDLAARQLAEAQARQDALGLLAGSEVLRFASAEASLAESLAQAEADRRARALELGRLLDLPPEVSRELEAVEPLPPPPVPESTVRAAELARGSSSTLLRLAAQVELSRDQVDVAEDALQPRLDVTAAFAVGESWIGTDYAATWDRPYFTATAGLRLEFPFQNDRAEAQWEESRLRVEAAEERLDEQIRAVETQAAVLLDRHETAGRRLDLARQSAAAAGRLAEAERGRLQLGLSTALEVVQAQEDQRAGDLRVLRAEVDRATAALAIGQLTGDLLASYEFPDEAE